MADPTHARKRSKGDFCAVAGTPCPCGHDYVEVCRPGWGDEDRFAFKYRQGKTKTIVTKVFEAHHLLCVASVGKIVVGNRAIGEIVKDTQWCVNEKVNMLAMPLWGHTVRWYVKAGGSIDDRSAARAPKFANIPQHDWDHTGDGGYIEELEPRLRDIVSKVSKMQKQHAIRRQSLAGELRALSKEFAAALKARGIRSGGTHAGWRMGRDMKKGEAHGAPTRSRAGVLGGRWYYPFSMADDGGVTGRGYPQLDFRNEAGNKLEWLAKKLKGAGG